MQIKLTTRTKKLAQDISKQKKTLIVDEEGQVVKICKKCDLMKASRNTWKFVWEKIAKLSNTCLFIIKFNRIIKRASRNELQSFIKATSALSLSNLSNSKLLCA